MLLEVVVFYAVACWISTLAFLVYGLIEYGAQTKWTWRVVARIVAIVATAPVSVPIIVAFILAASKFKFQSHENCP